MDRYSTSSTAWGRSSYHRMGTILGQQGSSFVWVRLLPLTSNPILARQGILTGTHHKCIATPQTFRLRTIELQAIHGLPPLWQALLAFSTECWSASVRPEACTRVWSKAHSGDANSTRFRRSMGLDMRSKTAAQAARWSSSSQRHWQQAWRPSWKYILWSKTYNCHWWVIEY
jgi:hypothetical protein